LDQSGERAVGHVRQGGPDRVADVVVYPVELPNGHCSAPGSTATPAPGTAPAVPGRGRSGASPSTTPPSGRRPTAPYPSPAGTAAGPGTGSPSVAGERRLDRRGRDVEAT